MLPLRLLQTQTDARLVELAAQGNERAFEALVQRYRKPLLRYARRVLLPEARAEDALQQAFLSAWLALQAGTEVKDPRAWLYRIAHNAAVSGLRRSGYDHDELNEALRGAEAPEADLERRMAVRQTLIGLAALPELQREGLLRTAIEGQSHEAVAGALGVSQDALRGLVYRARVTLRAAATAVTPLPVISWLASSSHIRSPMTARIAELVGGTGGTVGIASVLIKGSAVVATAGALATGTGLVPHVLSHKASTAAAALVASRPDTGFAGARATKPSPAPELVRAVTPRRHAPASAKPPSFAPAAVPTPSTTAIPLLANSGANDFSGSGPRAGAGGSGDAGGSSSQRHGGSSDSRGGSTDGTQVTTAPGATTSGHGHGDSSTQAAARTPETDAGKPASTDGGSGSKDGATATPSPPNGGGDSHPSGSGDIVPSGVVSGSSQPSGSPGGPPTPQISPRQEASKPSGGDVAPSSLSAAGH